MGSKYSSFYTNKRTDSHGKWWGGNIRYCNLLKHFEFEF